MIIIKKTKKDSEKKHMKDIKIFQKKKIKYKKGLEKDIKILLNKKKKKASILFGRSYLIIEEIIV